MRQTIKLFQLDINQLMRNYAAFDKIIPFIFFFMISESSEIISGHTIC